MIQMKEFREGLNLSQRDIIDVVQESAPGFDKYLLSKVERPEKYGIRLLNGIEKDLLEAYPQTAPRPRKPDRRKNPCRLYCRVGKPVYERLQRALRADGFETVQAGLNYIIGKYLEGRNGTEDKAAHI